MGSVELVEASGCRAKPRTNFPRAETSAQRGNRFGAWGRWTVSLVITYNRYPPSNTHGSWKLSGGFWKTTFLLRDPAVHFHDRWNEGTLRKRHTFILPLHCLKGRPGTSSKW